MKHSPLLSWLLAAALVNTSFLGPWHLSLAQPRKMNVVAKASSLAPARLSCWKLMFTWDGAGPGRERGFPGQKDLGGWKMKIPEVTGMTFRLYEEQKGSAGKQGTPCVCCSE